MNRVRVKVCGITNTADALTAARLGADAIGFVFYEKSPRYINPARTREIIDRLPPFLTRVGVFVDEDAERINSIVRETGLDAVQLHGSEPPDFCDSIEARVIKAIRIRTADDISGLHRYRVSAFLLDTYSEGIPGGTGETFDWDIAARAKAFGSVILSGGLGPDNVKDAIRCVHPYAVDVSSGVEKTPGIKDAEKLRAFIEAAKG